MRAKLWQLERALQFGPPELKSPTCCIFCINGDAALFEDAVHAARKSLSQAITCLSAVTVPVYAIWTEYRNTYAEIRAVKDELKELSAKSDRNEAAIKELSAKSDRNEAAIKELSAKSDRNEAAIKELSAKSDRNEAAIKELSAKSDRNEAAIKELSGKSDQLMEMMERIADRLGDPAQKDCNGHDCCCADSFNTLTVPGHELSSLDAHAFPPNLLKSMREPLPILGNNATLGNMDGVIGYSYAGLGNGEVVMNDLLLFSSVS